MSATRAALLILAVLAPVCHALAQAGEKPRVYALVSAIGSEITVVRQRRDVGSNIEPYRRYSVPVPGAAIDAAVLRGLDRAVAAEDPDSTRVFLRLDPEQVKGVYGHQRGEVLSAKVLAALEEMPERASWHRIVLVAPRYLNVAREGMGPKLHGIGVYIQPVRRRDVSEDADTGIDPETISPTGEKSRSYEYVAPYFYAQLWILDAKTLTVLETNERYDFQRIYDPQSAALDVAQSIPLETLSAMMDTFIERSAARTLNEQQGEVIIKEPRVVDPSPRT